MDGYRWAALVLLGGLIYYSLRRYHNHRDKALRESRALLDGWERVTLGMRQTVWSCPHCGAMCLDFRCVEAHQDLETSACAVMVKQRETAEQSAIQAAAEVAAAAAGRWSASATVGGEVTSGAVDSFAGELEGGGDDA